MAPPPGAAEAEGADLTAPGAASVVPGDAAPFGAVEGNGTTFCGGLVAGEEGAGDAAGGDEDGAVR